MNPEIRIMTILLIEKIRKNMELAENIAVKDSSHYKKDKEE